MERAVLSYRVRMEADAGHKPPLLETGWLDTFIASKPRLPRIAEQANNIIRFVGERVVEEGEPVANVPKFFGAAVGSLNRDFALRLTRQLVESGLVTAMDTKFHGCPYELMNLDLTLDGWERYEAELRGQTAGTYGFIALKFGDAVLDPFLRDVIKPAVGKIGYELTDIRDTAQAGIIDNLLRVRIRDAAFVLVDLTHDNAGAYWEAGYAEGLGKPVLYLCEQSKFDAAKTHFDTNHCTTVTWQADQPSDFQDTLVATLRRSLNLFAEK